MTTELYLFRHGRTDWNANGRYQGHVDIELDSLGHAQAIAAAERCRSIKPEYLLTSDLRRCADVAQKISEATGLFVNSDARLRERNVGEWSGKTRHEIANEYPEDFALWNAGDTAVRPGGGESVEDIIKRIKSVLDRIRELNCKKVVAVTHSGWIRSMMQLAFGEALSRRAIGMPSQGSLTVFVVNDDHLTLEAFNDRGHLMDIEPVDEEPPAPLVC